MKVIMKGHDEDAMTSDQCYGTRTPTSGRQVRQMFVVWNFCRRVL